MLLKPLTTILRPVFFVVETLWPCFNNGLNLKRDNIDGLIKKKINKIGPHVKMGWRISTLHHGGTSLCWPMASTSQRKNRTKSFSTSLFTGILTQCTVCSTCTCTLIINQSGIFDTPCIGNIHTFHTATNGNSFPIPRTTILRPIFYCINTFDRV